MIPLTLFLSFLVSAHPGNARTVADGFLITLNNDTVKCQIEVKGLELFDKVTVIDSAGKDITYKAKRKEIKGFSFPYKDEVYNYVLKVDADSNWRFLIRTAVGKRINLYYRFSWVYTGKGSVQSNYYLFESADRGLMVVEDGLFSRYKKDIREYLYGDDALIALFNTTVSRFSDIPVFVEQANARN